METAYYAKDFLYHALPASCCVLYLTLCWWLKSQEPNIPAPGALFSAESDRDY